MIHLVIFLYHLSQTSRFDEATSYSEEVRFKILQESESASTISEARTLRMLNLLSHTCEWKRGRKGAGWADPNGQQTSPFQRKGGRGTRKQVRSPFHASLLLGLYVPTESLHEAFFYRHIRRKMWSLLTWLLELNPSASGWNNAE